MNIPKFLQNSQKALSKLFLTIHYVLISIICSLLLGCFFLFILIYFMDFWLVLLYFVFLPPSAGYVGNQFRFDFDSHISLASLGFFGISLNLIIILK